MTVCIRNIRNTTTFRKAEPDDWAFIFASWSRVIVCAPVENRLTLLGMMASDAAAYADALRQQAIDDMCAVADDLGLVRLIGATQVQGIVAVAFAGGAA